MLALLCKTLDYKPQSINQTSITVLISFFQNDVTEQEQRFGSKSVAGSGHADSVKYVWNNMQIYTIVIELFPLKSFRKSLCIKIILRIRINFVACH